MSKRSRFLWVILTSIVTAFVFGIGIVRLAEAVAYVDVEVKVEEVSVNDQGQIINRTPFTGVTVWVANLPYLSENKICRGGIDVNRVPSASFNGSAASKKGLTDSRGIATIRLYPTEMVTYYVRVERLSPTPRLESCAFGMEMGSQTRGNQDDVFGPQVWKIEGVAAGQPLMRATFLYRVVPSPPPPPPEPQKGAISGTVKYAGTNNVISGATVNLLVNGNYNKNTSTGANGVYTFPDLAPSSLVNQYKVQVPAKECDYNESLAVTVNVEAGRTATQNLEVAKGGIPADKAQIFGKVINVRGESIAGATLTLKNAQNQPTTPGPVTTVADGTYTLCPVAIANYSLTASKDAENYLAETKSVTELSAGQSKEINFTLRKPSEPDPNTTFGITGGVYEGNCGSGWRVSKDATVAVRDMSMKGGAIASTKTSAEGKYTIEGIQIPVRQQGEPLNYIVEASKESFETNFIILNFNPLPGQVSLVEDIKLVANNTQGSIVGRVIDQKGIGLSQAEIWAVDAFDPKVKEKIATTDQMGMFTLTNLKAKYIQKPIKLKAVYTKDGQIFEGYYKRLNSEIITLDCVSTNIEIAIDLTVQAVQREITVIVIEDGKATNGADVSLEIEKEGQWAKISTKTTVTINGNDGIAKFSVPGGLKYRFSAVKGDKVARSKEYEPTSTEQNVILVLGLDVSPANPKAVTYFFRFCEGEKGIGIGPIKATKGYDRMISEALGAEKCNGLIEFLKIDGAGFTRSQWKIYLDWQPPPEAGVVDIKWDERMEKGKTNERNIYEVVVLFQDEQKKQEWAEKLFTTDPRPTFNFDIGPDVKKIKYESAQPIKDPKKIKVKKDEQGRILEIEFKVNFKYNVPGGSDYKIEIGSGLGLRGGSLGKFAERVSPVGAAVKVSRIERETSFASGDYPIVNGAIFVTGISEGVYKVELQEKGTGRYKIDSRNDKIIVGKEQITFVELRLCYRKNGLSELSVEGLNYKYFGTLSAGYYLFPEGALRAKSVLDRAKVKNVVYLGDSISLPEQSSYYNKSNLSYCATGADGRNIQDKEISGRSIVLQNPFLNDVQRSVDPVLRKSVIAAQFSKQAGNFIYNDLSGTQKRSWNRIVQALNSLDNPEKIYQRIVSDSLLAKYVSEDEVKADPVQLYALTVAAYKQSGAILQMQINQLKDTKQQNVNKALVRFVIETAGANNLKEENLYQSVAGSLSKTIYPVGVIISGKWLKK